MTKARSLGGEDPLEKGKATHSSVLAWTAHGQRSLAGYTHAHARTHTHTHTHAHTHSSSPGRSVLSLSPSPRVTGDIKSHVAPKLHRVHLPWAPEQPPNPSDGFFSTNA